MSLDLIRSHLTCVLQVQRVFRSHQISSHLCFTGAACLQISSDLISPVFYRCSVSLDLIRSLLTCVLQVQRVFRSHQVSSHLCFTGAACLQISSDLISPVFYRCSVSLDLIRSHLTCVLQVQRVFRSHQISSHLCFTGAACLQISSGVISPVFYRCSVSLDLIRSHLTCVLQVQRVFRSHQISSHLCFTGAACLQISSDLISPVFYRRSVSLDLIRSHLTCVLQVPRVFRSHQISSHLCFTGAACLQISSDLISPVFYRCSVSLVFIRSHLTCVLQVQRVFRSHQISSHLCFTGAACLQISSDLISPVFYRCSVSLDLIRSHLTCVLQAQRVFRSHQISSHLCFTGAACLQISSDLISPVFYRRSVSLDLIRSHLTCVLQAQRVFRSHQISSHLCFTGAACLQISSDLISPVFYRCSVSLDLIRSHLTCVLQVQRVFRSHQISSHLCFTGAACLQISSDLISPVFYRRSVSLDLIRSHLTCVLQVQRVFRSHQISSHLCFTGAACLQISSDLISPVFYRRSVSLDLIRSHLTCVLQAQRVFRSHQISSHLCFTGAACLQISSDLISPVFYRCSVSLDLIRSHPTCVLQVQRVFRSHQISSHLCFTGAACLQISSDLISPVFYRCSVSLDLIRSHLTCDLQVQRVFRSHQISSHLCFTGAACLQISSDLISPVFYRCSVSLDLIRSHLTCVLKVQRVFRSHQISPHLCFTGAACLQISSDLISPVFYRCSVSLDLIRSHLTCVLQVQRVFRSHQISSHLCFTGAACLQISPDLISPVFYRCSVSLDLIRSHLTCVLQVQRVFRSRQISSHLCFTGAACLQISSDLISPVFYRCGVSLDLIRSHQISSHLCFTGAACLQISSDLISPVYYRCSVSLDLIRSHLTCVLQVQRVFRSHQISSHLCFTGAACLQISSDLISPVFYRCSVSLDLIRSHPTCVLQVQRVFRSHQISSHLCFTGAACLQISSDLISPVFYRCSVSLDLIRSHLTCVLQVQRVFRSHQISSHLCFTGAACLQISSDLISPVFYRCGVSLDLIRSHLTCVLQVQRVFRSHQISSHLCFTGAACLQISSDLISPVFYRRSVSLDLIRSHLTCVLQVQRVFRSHQTSSHLCFTGAACLQISSDLISPVFYRCSVSLDLIRSHLTCVLQAQRVFRSHQTSSHLCFTGAACLQISSDLISPVF